MAAVVIAAGWGIATHDILAVDFGLDGNVLSDGEAEDVVRIGQAKPITDRGTVIEHVVKPRKEWAYIAVLGDTSIFSIRGNSFHSLGSRTGARSERQKNASVDELQ